MKVYTAFLKYNSQTTILLGLILFFFFQMFSFEVQGQRLKNLPANQPRLHWSVSLPDTSNMEFFRRYPDITKISMTIWNGEVRGVTIYKHKDVQRVGDRTFNLNFKGDSLVFRDQYTIPLNWIVPAFSTGYIQGDYVGYKYDSYSGTIYPDSIVLKYYENRLLSENKRQFGEGPIGNSFIGKIQDLADSIGLALEKTGYKNIGEEVVVFDGVVERDGKLSNLTQTLGDSTLFSETIALSLSRDYPDIRGYKRAIWHPAILSGRPVRSHIRIYAVLRDGWVYIEPSRGFYGFLPN